MGVKKENTKRSLMDAKFERDVELGILRGVIDPRDEVGFKNLLVDCIHWNALRERIVGAKGGFHLSLLV